MTGLGSGVPGVVGVAVAGCAVAVTMGPDVGWGSGFAAAGAALAGEAVATVMGVALCAGGFAAGAGGFAAGAGGFAAGAGGLFAAGAGFFAAGAGVVAAGAGVLAAGAGVSVAAGAGGFAAIAGVLAAGAGVLVTAVGLAVVRPAAVVPLEPFGVSSVPGVEAPIADGATIAAPTQVSVATAFTRARAPLFGPSSRETPPGRHHGRK
jgi:hypothetical protein